MAASRDRHWGQFECAGDVAHGTNAFNAGILELINIDIVALLISFYHGDG